MEENNKEENIENNISEEGLTNQEKPNATNTDESIDAAMNLESSTEEMPSDVFAENIQKDIAINQNLPTDELPKEINEEDNVAAEYNNEQENENPEELVTVRPVKFKEFEPSTPNRTVKKNYDIMQDISMHISVELGKTKSSIKEVIDLEQGSIVELDKIAGEQVEIYVNEKPVAKGEVIVIEDKFGVRVTSTNLQKNSTNP